MRIFITTLTGKQIELQVELSDAILSIMSKIKEKEGIPEGQQRLLWGGKQLREDSVVWEYNTQKDSVLHLVLRPRSSGQRDPEPVLLSGPNMVPPASREHPSPTTRLTSN